MAMNSPAAGDRILSTDVSGIVNFLTGVSGSGQALTLIYNAAGAVALQPSSDPAVSTQLVQVKNNAGTVKFAIRADGSLVFTDATVQTSAGFGNPMTTTGDVITGGASGAAGRLAIGTASQVLTVVAGAPAWAAVGVTVNNITTPHVFDDFTHGLVMPAATVSPVGSLNWQISQTAGTVSPASAVANHPGIARLDTTATSPGWVGIYGQLGTSAQLSILPADTFDITFVIRPGATVDANLAFVFGLADTSLTSAATNTTNGIYVEKRLADTTYFGVCRAASTQTRTAAAGTVTASTWTKFRIRRVDSSTIGFTQDAGAEVNVTTNIPTVAMTPFIHVMNNSAASKTLDIDLFDMTITGITR